MQHSYVDCAAEPGRLSPGVSEPFGLLLAMVDLWERKHKPPHDIWFYFSFSSSSNLMFVVIYLVVGGKEKEGKKKITRGQKDRSAKQSHLFVWQLETAEAFSQVKHCTDQVIATCRNTGNHWTDTVKYTWTVLFNSAVAWMCLTGLSKTDQQGKLWLFLMW